jgi:hypothetical protein
VVVVDPHVVGVSHKLLNNLLHETLNSGNSGKHSGRGRSVLLPELEVSQAVANSPVPVVWPHIWCCARNGTPYAVLLLLVQYQKPYTGCA